MQVRDTLLSITYIFLKRKTNTSQIILNQIMSRTTICSFLTGAVIRVFYFSYIWIELAQNCSKFFGGREFWLINSAKPLADNSHLWQQNISKIKWIICKNNLINMWGRKDSHNASLEWNDPLQEKSISYLCMWARSLQANVLWELFNTYESNSKELKMRKVWICIWVGARVVEANGEAFVCAFPANYEFFRSTVI